MRGLEEKRSVGAKEEGEGWRDGGLSQEDFIFWALEQASVKNFLALLVQVWCGVVWCGVVWCGVVWCSVVWCGGVYCDVVWCGVVWCSVVWWGLV